MVIHFLFFCGFMFSIYTDLKQILIALNPLHQLKQLLLDEVNKITKNKIKENRKYSKEQPHHEYSNYETNISLTSLYFRVMPMDEILSDDIICSIIPYLSGSNMYNKIPVINKHFNTIFKNESTLFSNYTIRLPLYINKSLHVCISHKLNRIQLSQNAKDSLLTSIIKQDKHCFPFVIHTIDDLNKYCPFIWDQIHKWHFMVSPFKNGSTIYHQQTTSNPWQHNLLQQIISRSKHYITSIKIELKMQKSRHDYLSSNPHQNNINHDDIDTMNNMIPSSQQDLPSSLLKTVDMTLLSNLNGVRYINFPSNEFIETFSNFNGQCNEILRNLLYLDLIRVNDITGDILKQLTKLLVLKLQFDDDAMINNPEQEQENQLMLSVNGRPITPLSGHNNNNNNNNKKYVIEFPSTIEFLTIDGFHFWGSEHVLNFKHLSNIIAISFRNSTFEQWMTNFSEDIDNDIIKNTINNHILWPTDQNNIQCVLLDEVSNDFEGVWYVQSTVVLFFCFFSSLDT